MKIFKSYRKIILILALPLFINCETVLEEEVKDFFTEDTFYKTVEDAKLAINGIYGHLGATFDGSPNATGVYFTNYWTTNAVMSDEGRANFLGNGFDEMGVFRQTPENPIVSQIWANLYLGINAANLAIKNIPDIQMNEELKDDLLGEAYFMRGLLYFELVRFYGDVPIVLEATKSFTSDSYAARNPISEVYAQIFSDWAIAENSLPTIQTGVNFGRPTSWSAKAYIAKGALQQGIDFPLAKTKLEEVINSGQFALWEDYNQVFKISNNLGKEALFSISFKQGNDLNTTLWEGGHLVFRTLPGGVYGGRPNGGGRESPTLNLYNAYEDLDRRKEVIFLSRDVIKGKLVEFDGPQIIKYWDRVAEPLVNNTENDLQLIRYADVLLMYAEVLNEIEQGSSAISLNAINQVRRRARFADGVERAGVLPNLTTLGYQEFKDAILAERRLELSWEGHRWFDLVRHGKLAEKARAAKPDVTVSEKDNLLPIPQRERDINKKLTQNPGY
jgi:hypothetical protein